MSTPKYDPDLTQFVKRYISENFDHFKELRLFGSRAKGTNRPNSDHDFYAIFSDESEFDNCNRQSMDALNKVRRAVKVEGFPVPQVDIFMYRVSTFRELASDPETFAFRALHEGIEI